MLGKPIGPLRQRMIDDMTARQLKEKVQRDYARHVRTFRPLPGPVAGQGDERGPSPLSAAHGGATDRRVYQRRRRRAALFLKRDDRAARPRSSSHDG